MPRSGEETKHKILSTAYALLYREGYARTSMDAIAEEAGITKKALYYHFQSKDLLVGTILDHQREHALDLFRSWADRNAEDPIELVSSLFAQLHRWVLRPHWCGSGFTRLTMEMADLKGHPARKVASKHKAEVEFWLATELERLGQLQAGRAARQVMLLIEGCISLVLIHNDPSYVTEAAQAAAKVLQNDAR